MSLYTQLSVLSVLASAILAAPAPQQNVNSHAISSRVSHRRHILGHPMTTTASSKSTTSTATTSLPQAKSSVSSSKPTSTTITTLITSISTSISSSISKTATLSTSSQSTSTATSSAAPTVSVTSGVGKRGLAYNDASYADLFSHSGHVTWAYDWWSNSNGLASTYNFVPLLWGVRSDFTDWWDSNVKAALASGSTHLLAFNEPDLDSQSNMTPAQAAAGYMEYMQPYAGQAKLGSPAITNGNTPTMGINWMTSFMSACSECTIDYIAIHWYNDPDTADDFKNHVTAVYNTFGKPIWITEFGLNNPTDSEVTTFLQEVLPWLDQQDFVERYAYFMTAKNFLVSADGSALSDYGTVFATYSG